MLDAHLPLILFSIDPHFMLVTPRRCEILSPQIRNKVWACLATRLNIQKKVVQSIVKLDRMIGRNFVKESEDSRDSSYVRVEYSLSSYIWFF
jgi:hypothetical protein